MVSILNIHYSLFLGGSKSLIGVSFGQIEHIVTLEFDASHPSTVYMNGIMKGRGKGGENKSACIILPRCKQGM